MNNQLNHYISIEPTIKLCQIEQRLHSDFGFDKFKNPQQDFLKTRKTFLKNKQE